MYDEARFTLHVVIDTSGEPLANSGTILIEAELDDTPDDSASPDTADTATPNSLARLRHRLWDACGREVTELAGSDAGSFGSSFVFPMEAAEDSPGDCDRGYDWCLFEAGHCELDIELSYELVAGSAALVDWKARVELSAIASGALGGGYPDEVTVLLSVE
jgi:hypothetical protein